MVRIGWERQPLLLYSDVHRIGRESFQHFQTPHQRLLLTSIMYKWGLPEGHSVLLHFSQNGLASHITSCPSIHELRFLQTKKG